MNLSEKIRYLRLRPSGILIHEERFGEISIKFRPIKAVFRRDGIVIRIHHVEKRPECQFVNVDARDVGYRVRLPHRPVRPCRAVLVLHV